MREVKITKLKNGLKLILVRDTSIHTCYFDLFVNFGGINEEIIIDDKKQIIPKGTAHFLEHILIEKSKYGNLIELSSKTNIDSNGITSLDRTNYYFVTLHNFKNNIKKLINAIHDKRFKASDISSVKKPILEELQGKKDNNFYKLFKLSSHSIFSSFEIDTIGDVSSINKIDYDILSLVHDVFYVPSNEMILLVGNFKIDEMISYIESIYDDLSFKNIKVELPKIKEPNAVRVKEDNFKTNTNQDYTRISYKINLSEFTPFERVKLSFYLDYLLRTNFSNESNLGSYLVNNNITVYDLDIHNSYIKDYLILEIGTFTNFKDEFTNLVTDKINNLELDEEKFLIYKNSSIIDFILREKNIDNFISPFMDNILSFNYYDYDKLSDVESLSFDEYKLMISKLDFSNYTINSFYKE